MVESGLGLLWRYARLSVRTLHDPRRYALLRSAVGHLDFLHRDVLPVAYLAELWPGIEHVQPRFTAATVSHHFELPYGERMILASMAMHLKPRVVFEFGTFTGTTTRLFAEVTSEGAVVHTIDLPIGEGQWEPWVTEAVGAALADAARAVRDKIVSHRCDTRRFDYSAMRGQVDFVFVDASHEYRDVLHDSERALEMISEGGVIIWDDYQPATPGVVRALNELRHRIPLVRIAQSRLVVYRQTSRQEGLREHPAEWADPFAPRRDTDAIPVGLASNA